MNDLRRKNLLRVIASLTLFCLITVTAAPGWTFTVKTHVRTANIAMADLVDGQAYLPGVGSMHRFNAEAAGRLGLALGAGNLAALLDQMCRVVEGTDFACRALPAREIPMFAEELQLAIYLYPAMVRGGAVGPDTFPDMLWGQQVAHVNHGRHDEGAPTALRRELGRSNPARNYHSGEPFHLPDPAVDVAEAAPVRRGDDPFTWRSIDHAIYLWNKALSYNAGAARDSIAWHQRLQALAFAYGYLLHVAGDAFAHSMVNRLAGGYFTFFDGTGLAGPLTEEVKHVAIELFIDAYMKNSMFTDPRYTRASRSNDPKVPGSNGVVAPDPAALPAVSCPPAPPERWRYCNPIRRELATGRHSSPFATSCQTRPENPWGSCDPWRRACFTAAQASSMFGLRDTLAACPSGTPGGLASCPGTPGTSCGLSRAAESMTPLSPRCDPNRISVITDRHGQVQRVNECIVLNCAFAPDRCPYEGIFGYVDRTTQLTCNDDPTRFTTGLAGFLNDLHLDAPVHFLYLALVEDPDGAIDWDPSWQEGLAMTTNYVRDRNLAGPHIEIMLKLRDKLEQLSRDFRGITLNPLRMAEWVAKEVLGVIPWVGPLLETIGMGLVQFARAVLDAVGAVVCALSFGLFCPSSDPPILTPSVLFGNRASMVREQMYRWMELSTCSAQNLVSGAATDAPLPDQCLRYAWYEDLRLEDKVRRTLAGVLGAPPTTPSLASQCLLGASAEAPLPPGAEVDHGDYVVNLEKMKIFLIDDTVGRVFSIQPEDLGLDGALARAVWIGLQVLVQDYALAPLKNLLVDYVGDLCHDFVAVHLPSAQRLAHDLHAMEQVFSESNPSVIVNLAYLREDLAVDPAYRAEVLDILGDLGGGSRAELETILSAPPSSAEDTARRFANVARVLRGSERFRALKGKKVRELERYLHVSGPGDALTLDRVPELWNAVQLYKLAALGPWGLFALAQKMNRIPAALLVQPVGDANPFTAVRAIDPKDYIRYRFDCSRGGSGLFPCRMVGRAPTPAEEIEKGKTWYQASPSLDRWCVDAQHNLMCNAVPSIDDPDDYHHYGMPDGTPRGERNATNQGRIEPHNQRHRSVVLDRVLTEAETQLSYHFTNFALAAPLPDGSPANVVRGYGQLFYPHYCPNPGPDPAGRWDRDLDWIADACDICPDDYDPGQEDKNADGMGDACDGDEDAVPNVDDNCPTVFNPDQSDLDDDGVGDLCDCDAPPGASDRDRDGIPDVCDRCPDAAGSADRDGDGVPDVCDRCVMVPDPLQLDGDGDGLGDACDRCAGGADGPDRDGDGVPDRCDNCPAVRNDQADGDRDGVGDACDNCLSVANRTQTDSDGDGQGNACDACPTVANGTEDGDGDGIPDGCDRCPKVPSRDQGDRDGDGIANPCDNCSRRANANQADRDCDGVGDVCDNCGWTPNGTQEDSDGDGLGDVCPLI